MPNNLSNTLAKAIEKAAAKVIPVVKGDKVECVLSMGEGCPAVEAEVLGVYSSFRGAVKVALPNRNVAFIDPRCVRRVL